MVVDKEALIPNSMALPSKASFVIKAHSKIEITEADAFAKDKGLPLIPLGEGTNIIPNDYIEAVVVILDSKGLETQGELLRVQAGERWDEVVAFAVEKNLSGLEALSAIPGKMGAAPIQNIGAYGSEIADTLEEVEVYNREKGEFSLLSKKDCQFGYRDSLFKKYPEKFIVSSVSLSLSNKAPKMPKYKDIENYFEKIKDPSPSLKKIREAIIKIRANKLPDIRTTPNCGSFFKNPIVGKREVEKIKKIFPDSPVFPIKNKFKIPAGFLIEKAGFKGQRVGKIEVYKNNALVLTNPDRVPYSDLMKAKDIIQNTVFQKFGVHLEPEVNIIG